MIGRLLILFLLAGSVSGQGFRDKVKEIEDYSIDEAREIAISDYELELTYGKIRLERGLLYVTGEVDGRPTAVYFQGEGKFFYWPVDEVEAQQINRFYRRDSIYVEFEECYFAFPSGSPVFADIRAGGEQVKPSYRVKTMFNHMRDMADSKFRYNLPLNLHAAMADGKDDFLWVDARKDQYHHTIYFYDPYAVEQVSVYKYTSNFSSPQLVSSVRDTLSARPDGYVGPYHITGYDLDVDISTVGESSIACAMQLEVLIDSMQVARLVLPEQYEVDSVSGDVAPDSLAFVKKAGRAELGIALSGYFYRGDTIALTVHYRGEMFRHYVGLGVVQDNLLRWYPTSGRRMLSDYTVRYTIDDGFDFLAVGTLVSDTIIEDRQVREYRSPRPLAYVSFNYGVFNVDTITEGSTPVVVYALKKDKSAVFGQRGVDKVKADMVGALEFFSERIAPYPFDTLRVDAMAVGYGQGSPGVVHLSERTFDRSVKGQDDKFRAHEVAHQWWGHLVGPASYRDVWLSEGLAEYSAAWYILESKGDEDTFREVLREWQKKITRRGKLNGQKSIGFRAGAIALGARLNCELSPGDYTAIVYYKAAYLVYMLRLELGYLERDSGTFRNMLKDFLHNHAGQPATTDDFITVARDYLGERTEGFFQQWLYDWRVPKIKTDWKGREDGGVEIVLDVQEVGRSFATPYPVRFILNDGESVERFYFIKSGENRFAFTAGVGTRIKKVEFNPGYDILEQ